MDHATNDATNMFASALLVDMMVGATKGAGDYKVGNEDRHHLAALGLPLDVALVDILDAVEGPWPRSRWSISCENGMSKVRCAGPSRSLA